jgi:hypothetical protein
MSLKSVRRAVSTTFIVVAVLLICWGGYGIATFPAEAEGSGWDERFGFFDNGYYPFLWGVIVLVVGALLRLKSAPTQRTP